jgi:hypothetical protein
MSNTFLDKPMESGAAVWGELGGSAQEKLSLGPPTLIKKSSIFLPFFRASTNHLGLAPLQAQVSPDGKPHHELIKCSK